MRKEKKHHMQNGPLHASQKQGLGP